MAESLDHLLGDGDGPFIHVVKPVIENVKVAREGELVILQIGSTTMRMKWQQAQRMGHWLLAKGEEAKVLSGNVKKRIEV